MITLFRTDHIYSLDKIKDVLAAQIRSLPRRVSSIGTPLKILRYEFPCPFIDVLTWLHNQHVDRKIYWSERDVNQEVGGIGVADIIEGDGRIDHAAVFAYMEDRLAADNPNLRYYGGMRFDTLAALPSVDVDWSCFGGYCFVIPRFELFRNGDQMLLAFSIAFKDINAPNIEVIVKELEAIDFSLQTVYRPAPKVTARHDYPDRQGWDGAFAKIKGNDGNFLYDKIVLARKSVFDFNVSINPSALLKHLKDKTPQCFHFCFQMDKSTAFLGATPERLYKRSGEEVETEAVAGTNPRGITPKEDAVFEEELLNSSKNALEHRYVVDAIQKELNELCTQVQRQVSPHLVKLEGGQHLVTRLNGTLRQGVLDDKIICCLHPTPAVAGSPKEEVLRAIKEVEPFDRGWYAGPVGYVGYSNSEFAVGIRSALVNHDKLSLYAGAGIVEGSTAQGEWQEIEMKIGSFIGVFDI